MESLQSDHLKVVCLWTATTQLCRPAWNPNVPSNLRFRVAVWIFGRNAAFAYHIASDKLNRHSESFRSCTSTVDSWVLFGFVVKCLGCTSGLLELSFSHLVFGFWPCYFFMILQISRFLWHADMLIMVLLSYNHCFVSFVVFQCQNHDFLILISHFMDPWLGDWRHFKWHNCIKQKIGWKHFLAASRSKHSEPNTNSTISLLSERKDGW